MAKYLIEGDRRLSGELRVHGSKNAALPLLAASILSSGEVKLADCPCISDVSNMIYILKDLGCTVYREEENVFINAEEADGFYVPDKYAREIRSSVVILGALLARFKQGIISYPGGCEIGDRPIDLHIKSFQKMGVLIKEEQGYLKCDANNMHNAKIYLDYPSVGATENIILAATGVEGETLIHNAAREPEIADLADMINGMGGNVTGVGTDKITIVGGQELSACEHVIIPDRIVAATYLIAGGLIGDNLKVSNVIVEHVEGLLSIFNEIGINYSIVQEEGKTDSILLSATSSLKAINRVKTQPYPGFPTDMQALLTVLLSVSKGTSIIREMIFENRFKHVPELIKMGANIKIEGRSIVIQGVKSLNGATVYGTDLRGCAALVLAGIISKGVTTVNDIEYAERGYQNLNIDLNRVGAKIHKI